MTSALVPFTPAVGDAASDLCAFASRIAAGDLTGARRDLYARSSGTATTPVLRLLVAQSLLADLAEQGWGIESTCPTIALVAPTGNGNAADAKERIRNAHLVERNTHLRQRPVHEFVASLEQRRLTGTGWHSVYSLMRDGSKLAASLQAAAQSTDPDPLRAAIDPYVVAVTPDGICPHTGLSLADVWRYFRLTWVNAPKSVPGRSMPILIRDRAAPNHPVIGIASLGSSVVQQGLRDTWIGWDSTTVIAQIVDRPTTTWARWILARLDALLAGIATADLVSDGTITRREIRTPTADTVERLRAAGVEARRLHELYPDATGHKRGHEDWKAASRTPLFTAKRCETLARLLGIRLAVVGAGLTTGTRAELQSALASSAFRFAVGQLARLTKAEHVGIDMMDITVCGAIAPYGHLLGGKLVCALLTSPEVVIEYRRRYGDQESIIASSVAGTAVRRAPNLVLLGTTSLYGSGSSQYNRIRIPLAELGAKGDGDLRYEELGLSKGYGSFHVSGTTVRLISTLLSRRKGGRKVNSIFGEGVNPLMRKIREALELLDLPSDTLLLHGAQRVVYGVPLARNFRDVLLGISERPSYFLPLAQAERATDALAAWWRRRWLAGRITRPGILDAVASHTLSYPVRHGARVPDVRDEEQETLFDDET